MTIEEIQAELQEEIDLCNKYFIEEDMHKESTEHERLALKIVTMCMQTLSALKDGALEDYKHVKQWKSDVMDSFCKYDCNSVEEAWHYGYNKAIDDFAEKLNTKCDGMIKEKWNSNVAPMSWAEAYADFKDDIEETAEQLRVGE